MHWAGMAFRRGALGAVLALCSLAAGAQQWTSRDGPLMTQTTVQRVVAQHQAERAWASGVSLERQLYGIPGAAGSVGASEKWKGPSPKVGEVVDVTVRRVLPWQKLAKAASRGLPLIGTALTIKEIMDAVRCREAPGGAGECDLGTPEVAQTVDCIHYGGSCLVGSAFDEAFTATTAASRCSGQACSYGPVVKSYGLCGGGSVGVSQSYTVLPPYCSGACTASRSDNCLATGTINALACPAITVNGSVIVPSKGPDGKCPTLTYTPAPLDDVASRVEQYGDKAKAIPLAGDLYAGGKPIEHDPPTYEPQTPVWDGRTTTTNPDGTTTIKDRGWDLTSNPDGYQWNLREVQKTLGPGETAPPLGQISGPGSSGSTSTGTGASGQEIVTCGLPGRPPCKIDETGTPTAQADDGTAKATGALAEIKACLLTPSSCLPALPALNWAFTVPTSCSPISLGAAFTKWAPSLSSVDLCPWQPMVHDIMSLVWAWVGFMGSLRIIGKD